MDDSVGVASIASPAGERSYGMSYPCGIVVCTRRWEMPRCGSCDIALSRGVVCTAVDLAFLSLAEVGGHCGGLGARFDVGPSSSHDERGLSSRALHCGVRKRFWRGPRVKREGSQRRPQHQQHGGREQGKEHVRPDRPSEKGLLNTVDARNYHQRGSSNASSSFAAPQSSARPLVSHVVIVALMAGERHT